MRFGVLVFQEFCPDHGPLCSGQVNFVKFNNLRSPNLGYMLGKGQVRVRRGSGDGQRWSSGEGQVKVTSQKFIEQSFIMMDSKDWPK